MFFCFFYFFFIFFLALVFNEHLLCARLSWTFAFSLAWPDEVSHLADEKTEATRVGSVRGAPWGLVQVFKGEPSLLPQGQGQGVGGMLPLILEQALLPHAVLGPMGDKCPVWHFRTSQPCLQGWFRDEHVTCQLKTFRSWAFPRAMEGQAGNFDVALLVDMRASSRKGQTVHEATAEGSIAERQAVPPHAMWPFSAVCTGPGPQ